VPRIEYRLGKRLYLALALAIVLLGFTPISHVLLRLVNGSFAPTSYTSLALRTPSEASTGIKHGVAVQVELTNRSGHVKSYRWQATQSGVLIGTGLEKLANGQADTIRVPTTYAARGKLRVGLVGTDIYVSVPILKS
jgi:hypothetical protein